MIAPKKAPLLDAAALADRDLDRLISDGAEKIRGALVGYERAIMEQRKCQKSAVLSAWRVGGLLIEKKSRLAHGEFLPWLTATGISSSSSANYMKIAAQISDAGNLRPSISQTLKALEPPPEKLPVRQPPAAPRPAAVQPAEKLPAPRLAAVQPAAGRGRIEELEEKILVLEDELVEERKLTEELRRRIPRVRGRGGAEMSGTRHDPI